MKTIDCITYFNEPLLFELRLNILNNFVDEFIVCEAKYTHAGRKKELNFNINKYERETMVCCSRPAEVRGGFELFSGVEHADADADLAELAATI